MNKIGICTSNSTVCRSLTGSDEDIFKTSRKFRRKRSLYGILSEKKRGPLSRQETELKTENEDHKFFIAYRYREYTIIFISSQIVAIRLESITDYYYYV